MSETSPFGPDTERYWAQRHDLFSRFDEGVRIDREGLFSVKPEGLALDIARRLPGDIVLDAFCGVGGSAIAFARAGRTVIGVDTDVGRLDMARSNARLYGVDRRIEFVHADARDIMRERRDGFDCVYLDPPWGGLDYYKAERFTLSMFEPDARPIVEELARIAKPYALTIPKNFDLNELRHVDDDVTLHWGYLGDRLVFGTVFVAPRADRMSVSAGPA